MACFTRSRSAVNGVEVEPGPMPTAAIRSDGCSRSMNPLTVRRNADRSAEADVRLIDDEQNQPPAGDVLVRGVARRRRRRLGLGRRDQRHPLGAHDAARRAVDLDAEVLRRRGR